MVSTTPCLGELISARKRKALCKRGVKPASDVDGWGWGVEG